jgi:beta-glucosidase
VTMTLTRRAFAYWDSSARKWRVTPGLYRILVGSSSRDIRLHGFLRKP